MWINVRLMLIAGTKSHYQQQISKSTNLFIKLFIMDLFLIERSSTFLIFQKELLFMKRFIVN